ncbi:ribosome biogenesis GTPase YlqF [Neptuniibacter sp. CAU 1671]|uniref:ribosome biogenesis GTPase YlqF n=1 Tax=Neptuniibacter sp. CAU 1671 TaxID=3032593 RepID=UPI0023D99DAA|nr:ribosome biogenesis GTPase YlqF [Neptuniibacter sp. CAU 1671]MDF2180437.1 ribosome biogenesis GTPase YlqF [Neptuniibacter sp. CAU 1671]
MSINWFPGHMHKARKEIAEVMDEIDVIIEVLDARLPRSSENPLVDKLRKGKPVLKILNKSDLADPEITKEWLAHFNSLPDIQAIALTHTDKKTIQSIFARCKQMVPSRSQSGRPVRTMIMGIPNVGKSTLINTLLGRKIAKVGNEPAVTKSQKRYTTHNGLALSDTPGILWPKIEDVDSGYRLAASGAIRDTAIEHEDVALFTAKFLRDHYEKLLTERFKIKELSDIPDLMLDEIGRRRGCLKPGGIVDRNKAATLLLNELRSGKLGLISFETVAEWQEKDRLAELARLEAMSEGDESNDAD